MESVPQPFFRRQIWQIRHRGPREAVRRFIWLIQASLAWLVVLAVHALKPLVTIRIGTFPGQFIGNLAPITDLYLCERNASTSGSKTIDIFYFRKDDHGICNAQLKKMWERRLNVYPFPGILDKAYRRLPEEHHIPWRADHPELDIFDVMDQSKPHVSFTNDEEKRGKVELLKMGIPESSEFVCFHARDKAFTLLTQPKWNQHESDFRNCSIANYLPAAKAMAARGHFSIRMGANIERPLPATSPGVIDYATLGTTDFLDIYMSAKCRFFVGCTSGLFTVAQIFRLPLVLTNWTFLSNVAFYSSETLFIPKKLWSHKNQRLLNFNEILNTEVRMFLHSEEFDQAEIELIENTPEEIMDVVMEMEERLNGTWQATKEDEELQSRFWSNFQAVYPKAKKRARIGTNFIRDNVGLLG